MQKICTSLANNGYNVILIGKENYIKNTEAYNFNFKAKLIKCWFTKGFAFYAEYNIKLFFYLLFIKVDAFCAIDLDTILPNYLCGKIKNKPIVYDAHELFTEQKEIVTRPLVHKFWLAIEKFCVPKFKYGYTVNYFIQQEFAKKYNVAYEIIRNIPVKTNYEIQYNALQGNDFIIYQGAVNEGRSFETLIPAMQHVNCCLHIYGVGNYFTQTKALIKKYNLQDKVVLKGTALPKDLKKITPQAKFGITIFEATGLNQYYSLSNRFFDYTMAGIPQICVNYPEYKAINDEHNIALLIPNVEIETIATAINELLQNKNLYNTLKQNCINAREQLNWQNEELKLIAYWKKIVPIN